MSTLTWVLVGLALYWAILLSLRNRGLLPEYVGTQGPIITLHTKRGRVLLDRLARPKRFWRAFGNVGVGIALVVMALSFAFVLFAAVQALYTPETTASVVTEPRNVVVIPGVNDFLPLSVAPEIVFGLLVALVVHEGAHGLLCRVEDIDIESMGVALLAIVPMGAFVEPNHESQEKADRGGRTRMFAAGVTANFLVTIIAFALLFGPVAGSIAVAPGVAVGGTFAGSPADDAGIGQGDRITAVGSQPVADDGELDDALAGTDGEATLTLDGEREVTVDREVSVVEAVESGPSGLAAGDRIASVNGQPVTTESGFREALADRPTATVETAAGQERTFAAGALSTVVEDSPASEAGMPAGQQVVITAVDGERVVDGGELTTVLQGTEPGQTVEIEAVVDGEVETYGVELGEHPEGYGQVGIQVQPGVTGLVVDDLGVQPYPAGTYLSILDGEGSATFVGAIAGALVLPIAGIGGLGLPFNFAGFTGHVTEFYAVEGALAPLGGGVFLLANLLFWTGWINLNLGFFNCIPAFPLDGGHILRTSTEAVVSRLPIRGSYELTKTVTISVGVTMLFGLLLMVFGQGLLV
ncbi:site-2 protease family protein [Halalkalicoccus jeotgali]|uniref:Peptidase M50 n=1 Tax=Halalkalicoccus jeotgali (strain DSM 18796 / CECT 7217 / JCM 14584 / KCTC 4019 / B3) TaxID=795797 RepID=D8J8R9_HALJB|nr:site-2 protease family protein [Halalkalicoccus jeotgali]ADJ14254.1 peptidase M50 [Halalkalicoccus jeotgali B3]ELY40516.1 peptidase M50 [Halalkalicoccus jeotgali B3]